MLAWCFIATVRAAAPEAGTTDVFLLMGQSNMAGYGTMLPEDKQPHEGIFVLRGDAKQGFRWEPAAHPFHTRHPASDRYGLGGAFALLHREMWPTRTVGLIPLAWGGAPLSNFVPGTPFYADTLAKARWAAANGTLRGILWHQGESDTVRKDLADTYETRLTGFLTQLRADLGQPALPIVIGDLAEFYPNLKGRNPEQIATVRAALRKVAQTLPKATFVPSTGLRTHDGYNVHFNRASYVIFGARYFDAYWQLVPER